MMKTVINNMKCQNDLQQFASLIRKVIKTFHGHGHIHLIEENLTFSQYYALSLLSDGRKHEMGALKKNLAITGAVATGVADHLVKKKLAERGRWTKEDRRVVNIGISKKGKELIKRIDNKRLKFLGMVLSGMSKDERKTLIEGLKILSDKTPEVKER